MVRLRRQGEMRPARYRKLQPRSRDQSRRGINCLIV
jgi:hypothetical protein